MINERDEAATATNTEGLAMAHECQAMFSADAEAMEKHRNAAGVEKQLNKPATNWMPNARFEELYNDLSDLSSLDGNESPRHKEMKEYAKTRRVAKARLASTSMPDSGAEVFLGTCSKEEAESAAAVRQKLIKSFGQERALSLLAPYKNKVMRGSCGKPQRFFVDASGLPLRVVRPNKITDL